MLADQAGTIVGWNGAAEEMFGYARPEVLGRPLTIIMPERFREAHQAGLGRLAGGDPPKVLGTILELAGRRQDGTEFPLELSLSTWTMAGAACFSGILRDITERKRVKGAAAAIRLETGAALQASLERSELQVWYQPQVSLRDPGIVGAEALLRWQHPDRGLLSPAQFIPEAEQTGLIVPIGNWVLGVACRQLADWRKGGAPPLTVSVNVSAVQLAETGFPGAVAEILAGEALDPSALWLEIPERFLGDDPEAAVGMLTALKELGVKLAVEVSGTGHSSPRSLRRFPLDALKIGRSFLRGSGQDDDATVRRIIQLARNLGLVVVAVGVETDEQLEALISLECDRVQGFYFAWPVEPEVFTRHLGSP